MAAQRDLLVFLDTIQEALQQAWEASSSWDELDGDLDGVLVRLDSVFQSLMWVKPLLSPSVSYSNLLAAAISDMIGHVQSIISSSQNLHRRRGRPALDISEDVLASLLEQQFTQVEIAQMLGCFAKTVHRRIIDFGLSHTTHYSTISDGDLDLLVRDFVPSFPTAGQKTLARHLHTLGHRIQCIRIWESLCRVDPVGVKQRNRHLLHCQKYKVPGLKNGLWLT